MVRRTEQIATGPIPGWQVGEPDHVAVEYDPLANSLGVWVNGEAIALDGQPVAGPLELEFTPDIRYAGIDIQDGTQGATVVDNFEVLVDWSEAKSR